MEGRTHAASLSNTGAFSITPLRHMGQISLGPPGLAREHSFNFILIDIRDASIILCENCIV